ncbi:hypothetical protein [Hymenobacter metallicola]|uniref:Uncharacterized protein n=1 Tax=Hymenobacter metallicola TaxID=2563114 RepID=A0A4Z0PZJ7_9BACT|nr:hypothetical protein [Hymenobacter metallicola]TGE22739.1 hypothetical protein E5K02_23710 [Hymenobacter metallicola]
MEQDQIDLSRKTKKTRMQTYTSVGIEPAVHGQLAKTSKLCKLTKSAYATAAVAYFTERGLNPVTDRTREAAIIQDRIDKRSDRLELLLNALGQRLEKQQTLLNDRLLGLLKNQESALFSYLTEQEENVYAPLIHELLLAGTEALIARKLTERIYLELTRQGLTLNSVTANQDEVRDTMVAKKKQNFVPILPNSKQVTSTANAPANELPTPTIAGPKDTY